MNTINLNVFLDWIRQINGGSVVPKIVDEESEIFLPGENVVLYYQPLKKGGKYFFFANLGDNQDIEEAVTQIEAVTIQRRNEWSDGSNPHPSDSYMIYIWKVKV